MIGIYKGGVSTVLTFRGFATLNIEISGDVGAIGIEGLTFLEPLRNMDLVIGPKRQ
jgi:hypothetical protein